MRDQSRAHRKGNLQGQMANQVATKKSTVAVPATASGSRAIGPKAAALKTHAKKHSKHWDLPRGLDPYDDVKQYPSW